MSEYSDNSDPLANALAVRAINALCAACDYVGMRTDGDIAMLAERCELWMRESRVLIDLQKQITARQPALPAAALPPLPIAFFDEFGQGADDRVQDYARAAVAGRKSVEHEPHQTVDSARELAQRAVDSVALIGTLAGLPEHVQKVVKSYAGLVARTVLLHDGGQPVPAAVPLEVFGALDRIERAAEKRRLAYSIRDDIDTVRAALATHPQQAAASVNINAIRYLYLRAQPAEGGPWGTPRIAIPSSERAGQFANGDDADAAIDAAIASLNGGQTEPVAAKDGA